MKRILVVEDSPTQTIQIRHMLSAAGYQVETAVNGKLALRQLEKSLPDLVLTDMVMPEMDGLMLVNAIRAHFPSVPVILMTSQGTDAIAIEALESGASGYVPKSQINDRLVNAVAHVFHVTGVSRSYEMLLKSLVQNEFTFSLANEIHLIDPLVNLLQQMAQGMGICEGNECMRLGVALEHALLNAMCRGNLELTSRELPQSHELLMMSDEADVVQMRKLQPPYKNRKVTVKVSMSLGEAHFIIRDEGRGFNTSTLPKPGDSLAIERIGGQGLVLMRTFMDGIAFNELGNEVTMLKRRK